MYLIFLIALFVCLGYVPYCHATTPDHWFSQRAVGGAVEPSRDANIANPDTKDLLSAEEFSQISCELRADTALLRQALLAHLNATAAEMRLRVEYFLHRLTNDLNVATGGVEFAGEYLVDGALKGREMLERQWEV